MIKDAILVAIGVVCLVYGALMVLGNTKTKVGMPLAMSGAVILLYKVFS